MNFDQLITILRELDTSLKGQVIRTANVGLTLRNRFEGKKVRQRPAFPASPNQFHHCQMLHND